MCTYFWSGSTCKPPSACSLKRSRRAPQLLNRKLLWCRKVRQAEAARCSWISTPQSRSIQWTRCHLNAMVADTQKWEQSAAFLLDSHVGVKSWVKNDRLGFFIPYRNRGLTARYIPDFLVVTNSGQNLIVEVKGQLTDRAGRQVEGSATLGGCREPARSTRHLALSRGYRSPVVSVKCLMTSAGVPAAKESLLSLNSENYS